MGEPSESKRSPLPTGFARPVGAGRVGLATTDTSLSLIQVSFRGSLSIEYSLIPTQLPKCSLSPPSSTSDALSAPEVQPSSH